MRPGGERLCWLVWAGFGFQSVYTPPPAPSSPNQSPQPTAHPAFTLPFSQSVSDTSLNGSEMREGMLDVICS